MWKPDWEATPFKSLDQARELLKPHGAIQKKWINEDRWMEFFVVRDEEVKGVRHIVAQATNEQGRVGPVKMAEIDVPLLAPDHRCLRTGKRYVGDWHHNPDIHGEATGELIAQGYYKAVRGKSGFIHEVLYDSEGRMFWRILCPPVE